MPAAWQQDYMEVFDALGCGGALSMLAANGAKIKVIYFSDGARRNALRSRD